MLMMEPPRSAVCTTFKSMASPMQLNEESCSSSSRDRAVSPSTDITFLNSDSVSLEMKGDIQKKPDTPRIDSQSPPATVFNTGLMKKELESSVFWRDVGVEFLGTFILVSVQCMVPLAVGADNRTPVTIALAMGFVVMVLVETFSGMGHSNFNPAVTIGLLVANKITVFRGLCYIALQVLGAIAGAAFIYVLTPGDLREALSGTSVNRQAGIALWQGVLVEAWLTGILMLAIFGATNDRRRKVYMPALPIGLAVALDILTGIRYTGSSMNPARSLGPAVMVGSDVKQLWEDQWVYWVGPISGAVLCSAIYNYAMNPIGLLQAERQLKKD